MSFETARPVTPESLNQDFPFSRRPQVRYPMKQTVQISQETIDRVSQPRAPLPRLSNFAYSTQGRFERRLPIGQFLNQLA